MAKKKEQTKQETQWGKFYPGESTWQGRKNKTRQDRMPMQNRDRAINAQRVRSFSEEHKPSKSSDWLKLRNYA